MSRMWTTSPEKIGVGMGVGVKRGVGVRVGVGVGVIVFVGVIVVVGGRDVLVQVGVIGWDSVGDGEDDGEDVGVAVWLGVTEGVDAGEVVWVGVAEGVELAMSWPDGAATGRVGSAVRVGEGLGALLAAVGDRADTAAGVGVAAQPASALTISNRQPAASMDRLPNPRRPKPEVSTPLLAALFPIRILFIFPRRNCQR
jgi:hypothetical protein